MKNLKKITALVLAASILLCGCAGSKDEITQSEAVFVTDTSTETKATDTTANAESSVSDTQPTTAEVTTAETTTAETEITTISDTDAVSVSETASEMSTTSTAATTEKVTEPTTTTTKPEETTAAITTAKPIDDNRKPVSFDEQTEELYEHYDLDTDEREEYYEKLMSETALPIIHISTYEKQDILSLEEYTECLVDVFNCGEEYVKTAAPAGIRLRGNSTAFYGDAGQARRNQVPYRIKFDKKQSMLGLNDGAECKSWVLLKSNWNLVMDYTAFSLADEIFDDEYYSSDCTFVYVYVNNRFRGLYVLCEQNQVNKNRVDISEPEENYTDTDIGYFVEIDNYASDDEGPHFTLDYCGATLTDIEGTTRALEATEVSIKSDIYSDEQKEFIAEYVNNVYKIMYEAIINNNYLTFDENYKLISAKGKYKTALETINAVADVHSMVYMYILYELVHDYDCGEGSFYMAVDFSDESKFTRLTFTAPWDFNWAYNDSPIKKYWAGGFNEMSFVNQYGDRSNPWFILLMSDSDFVELVKEKWNEIYPSGELDAVISDIYSMLDEYSDDLTVTDEHAIDSADTLLKWLKRRISWLNREWGK